MIKFLIKGILRDRSRSLFPILIVVLGVMLAVFMHSWIKGAEINFVDSTANFKSGHVNVMSRAYLEESESIPNDLAYIGVNDFINRLEKNYPQMTWTPRIRFGGLLDIPDEKGETKTQGPVSGVAVDIFSKTSPEKEILNLKESIVRGRIPEKSGEILISEQFARRLGVQPGETATLLSSTMYGSMATANFEVAGTVRFGITAMDRGSMIADITDIQYTLNMEDAAGEILGFLKDGVHREEEVNEIKSSFNDKYRDVEDEFAPVMSTLRDEPGIAEYLDMISYFSGVLVFIFIVAMSIVLWNAGLMGNLRRYGEIGIRLAIGEKKGHLYRSMLAESMMIGCIGTVIGTAVGLALSYYLEVKGIDISGMMKNASIMFSEVMRAKVTIGSYFIGFIPGLGATFLGATISGIGIYRRQPSQLTKELET